jgi:hypothetical protein
MARGVYHYVRLTILDRACTPAALTSPARLQTGMRSACFQGKISVGGQITTRNFSRLKYENWHQCTFQYGRRWHEGGWFTLTLGGVLKRSSFQQASLTAGRCPSLTKPDHSEPVSAE